MTDCMYTFVSFTVAELFEKVWETPMVKLAHDIGVSDVAVAKACRKAGIPLPLHVATLSHMGDSDRDETFKSLR